MLHEDITKSIIGAGMQVLNELRPGLDEKLYENALVLEMIAKGNQIDQQQSFPVNYRGQNIGKLIPDLIIDSKVVVDTKVVNEFNDSHVAQMIGYLNMTKLEVGLLINFKHKALKWKRIINDQY